MELQRTKTLIEVGTFDGTDSLSFYNKGYKVYTFEPEKKCFEYVKNKTRGYPDYTIFEKAVCLTDGIAQFNICKLGGASSILQFKSGTELRKHWKGRKDIEFSGYSYPVQTIRLDTFIEQNDLQNTTIDYLHIDAQGVDLDVLQSLGKYIENVKEGVVETVNDKEKAIYVNQINTMDKVINFLTSNNFSISSIKNNDTTACEFNVHFLRKT